ncbi:hypothetical protein BJ170DRAFT_446660 [Xylariales sp. AK1849]|nr:hypothetical protein BJ170DRAFT_446660 [Xylariales sp. AK1849]
MRLTSFLAAGVFALTASAQSVTKSATTTDVSSMTSTATSVWAADSATAAILDCLAKCDADDTDCRAHCTAVPSPGTAAINATTECVNECPQGNGTAEDNANYGDCVQDCITKYYYVTSSGTPSGTAGAGSGSAGSSASTIVSAIVSTVTSAGSTFATTIGSTTISAAATGTSSSTTSSSSGAAGTIFRPMSSSVGFLGFIAALLAL